MRTCRVAVLLTAVLGVGAVVLPGGTRADASDTPVPIPCSGDNGAITNPYTVKIDGNQVDPVATGRYDYQGVHYWVLVCNDTRNHAYVVSAGRANIIPDGSTVADRFTTDDLDRRFEVSFLPESGATPWFAEGHGAMSGLTIDANDSNRVTLVTKPLLYSDIYGSDCNNKGPAECVIAVHNFHNDRASADNIEIRVSIRYTDTPTSTVGNFQNLQGMYWSSAAYYFWMNTACPTNGATSNAIQIDVGGPHLHADGTQNYGSVTVFLPTDVVIGCFGAVPSVVAPTISMTRTEGSRTVAGTTGDAVDPGLEFTVSADDSAGLTIRIPQVTFSKPRYKMKTRNSRSVARLTRTASQVFSLARLSVPRRGSYSVVTTSPSVCKKIGARVYAYAKGKCTATVTTYDRYHVPVASKAVSFTVN